ncbi:SMP-30/gluconolaconase/LRE-like protein [Larkinella arboricola]|uniref:SMP-30/gluconolaconase/LRE-like protein n=1 Tax=Larkinella arboricola TaxID=643671 RepID=A0A327WWI8_LARAB|nr:SMP-30/gluconolactonase/LRE family protein [Larkinella arboricola]RAJ97509.1 SMP-30/gluconolaconase/LRE-like protein [Larkinella arboricola]
MRLLNFLLGGSILLTVTLSAFESPKKEKKLVKVWETDSTLSVPESVLYDPKGNVLYVANIVGKSDSLDGDGFISKVSLDGKIENLKWTTGLNAPKGMGIYKNRLYVTDVYRLVALNLSNGQAEQTWDATDKKAFLNDVTVDKNGTIYVSDNRNNKIYRLKDDKWEIWMDGGDLNNPNGLLAVGTKTMMVGSTKIGALQSLDVASKKLTKIADGMANTDGIVAVGKDYIVSDWNGRLFYITANGQKQQLLDTRNEKVNSADIDYVPGKKLVVVPTFFKNKLVAYRVE